MANDNMIKVDPKTIQLESIRFGTLVKVIVEWAASNNDKVDRNAAVIMASMAMLSGNLPENSGVTGENLANIVIELYFNRGVQAEGSSFIFPQWEKGVDDFDKELGDLGMFTIHSCIGFHLGYDSIEQSVLIYPYRPLILQYAREGYDQLSDAAKAQYKSMYQYFLTNDGAKDLYKAICDVVKEQ